MDPKKENLIVKTWKKCKSIGRVSSSSSSSSPSTKKSYKKSKSWSYNIGVSSDHDDNEHKKMIIKKRQVVPAGCFSVYVGHDKKRFVIKTEYANHPLFKTLLEEAESEYGYGGEGPLVLPCKVDVFCKVLLAIEEDGDGDGGGDDYVRGTGCGFGSGNLSPYRILSPHRRMMAINYS